ncbi:hypothetical protein SDC9_134843 [bioreactor metagenome]|uniref:Uncharacterized protein n=1 Tax=bioreactor metagenome TaxID=1076179 RepID=A0A645DFZ3_9ZZZZ
MGAGKIELYRVCARKLAVRRGALPLLLDRRVSVEDACDDGAVRPPFFQKRDVFAGFLVCLLRSQFDIHISENHVFENAAAPADRENARRDVPYLAALLARVLCQRLDHRAAPAGLKGAVDHIAVARRRRGGEHKWIWHFYSEEIGAKILSHGSILQISLSVAAGKT